MDRSARRTPTALPTLFALTLILSAMGFVQPAQAATNTAAAGASEIHCKVVIDKLRPGETTSRVKSSECVQGDQAPAALASEIPIITYYEHINWTGSSKTVYGSAGPCDASGYAISDVGDWWSGWWNRNISSWRYGNNCYYQNAYTGLSRTGTCAHYHGNVGYPGASMNDRISSFRVSSAFRLCAWR